jgi:hypothetical protein
MMQKSGNVVVATLVAVLAGLPAGCSGSGKLDGAKIDIPVFSPSTLDDEHTATTSDDLHDLDKFSTHSWEFSTTAAWSAVDAFYREKLSSAQRDDETSPVEPDESPLENEIRYLWVPPGWTGGAKVLVLIRKETRNGKTRFELTQDLLKHP